MKFYHVLYQSLTALAVNICLLLIRFFAPKWLLFKFIYELLLICSVFGTPVLFLWALFKLFVEQEQDTPHWLAVLVLLIALTLLVVVVLPASTLVKLRP